VAAGFSSRLKLLSYKAKTQTAAGMPSPKAGLASSPIDFFTAAGVIPAHKI